MERAHSRLTVQYLSSYNDVSTGIPHHSTRVQSVVAHGFGGGATVLRPRKALADLKAKAASGAAPSKGSARNTADSLLKALNPALDTGGAVEMEEEGEEEEKDESDEEGGGGGGGAKKGGGKGGKEKRPKSGGKKAAAAAASAAAISAPSPPSPLTRAAPVVWGAVEAAFKTLCEKNTFTDSEAKALYSILCAALCAVKGVVWSGSGPIAASGLSERIEGALRDLDISFPEAGTKDKSKATPTPNLDKILNAIRAAVGALGGAVNLPGAGALVLGKRFINTTAPGVMGVAASGRYLDIPLTFNSGRVVTLQLCERDEDWSGWDLTGRYWAKGFMEVLVEEDPKKKGKLHGLKAAAPPPNSPAANTALVNVIELVNVVKDLAAPEAAQVMSQFLDLLGGLLEEDPDGWDHNLTSKHATFDANWMTQGGLDSPGFKNWDKLKDAQEKPMMREMPVFGGLLDQSREKRRESKDKFTVVDKLRKGKWIGCLSPLSPHPALTSLPL